MSNYPIIVLDGPDGTGKSTLANRLCHELGGRYLHLTYRWPTKMFDYHTAGISTALHWSEKQPVVLDRWWPSEIVYADAYRNGSVWPYAGQLFEKIALKHAITYIFCQPTDRADYLRHYNVLKGQREEMYNEGMEKVYDGFRQLMASPNLATRPGVLRYDFNKVNFEEFVQLAIEHSSDFRSEQYIFALRKNYLNLTGHWNYAKYLIVGDESKPKTRRQVHPFFEYGNSSLWLAKITADLGIPEHQLCYTNAKYSGPGPDLRTLAGLAKKSNMQIVAMGQVATEALNSIGVDPDHTIRHPQWYRRFNSRMGKTDLYDILRRNR